MKQHAYLRFLFIIACFSLFVLNVSANSAMTYWSGSSGSNVISSDENCPVEAVHENLTFSLPFRPVPGNAVSEKSGVYENSYTAEYTFHNASDMKVETLLSFPLGKDPAYLSFVRNNDSSYYEIRVNGEITEPLIRYTFKSDQPFSLEKDLPALKDTYMEDDFFSPDLPVYEYHYRLSYNPEDLSEGSTAYIRVTLDDKPQERRYMLYADSMRPSDGSVVLGRGIHADDQIVIRCFGKNPEEPDLSFYISHDSEETELNGKSELTEVKEMTYEEYVLALKKEPEDISDVDFYNAFTSMINSYYGGEVYMEQPDISQFLMKWLQYMLVFEPDETLINSVKAPAYPDIDTGYSDPVYTYDYLLSPAGSWKSFGTLDVNVETDLNMLENNGFGFEKTEQGYTVHFDGLPEKELSFKLCASEKPKKDVNWSYAIGTFMILGVPLIGMVLFIVAVALLIRHFVNRKKK